MAKYLIKAKSGIKDKEGNEIITRWVYNNLDEALRHKKLCDEWDKSLGDEPKVFTTKIEM